MCSMWAGGPFGVFGNLILVSLYPAVPLHFLLKKQDLQIHKSRDHGIIVERFYCRRCQESFSKKSSLVRHMASVHGPGAPCFDCGAALSNRTDNRHRHSGSFCTKGNELPDLLEQLNSWSNISGSCRLKDANKTIKESSSRVFMGFMTAVVVGAYYLY